MVSRQLTNELQKILRKNYGVDLSFEETSKVGRELADYFDLLAEIDYQNKIKNKKIGD